MSDQRVRVTIDGREVETAPGTLLVTAAEQAGIEIPVFCYHPKLDPAGLCRMCLVEVEGIPKPVTACTTPVRDGMVVHTQSERVQRLQRGVLEFLLINHPLDCPVCDKGGECPLQDNTFRYGPAVSRMYDGKMRKRKAVQLGNFIVLDEERCILCRRCTRFDDEIAAEGNLIVGQRGHHNIVTTATGQRYNSYFSGNVTELCPVGALTSDLYRFKARPWDLSSMPSVCTGCSLGCNVRLDFRFGKLLRIMSRDNPAVDNGWLCDRGRYNFKYIDSEHRVTQPLIRKDGQLVPASWAEALQLIGQRLAAYRRESGGEVIGLLGGGRLTNEEAYLFQKLGRAVLGTPHIDYRTGFQVMASSAEYPARVTDIDDAGLILLVDLLPQERVPVLDLRIRRVLERKGTPVISIGAAKPVYRGPARHLAVQPGETEAALAQVRAALARGDGASAAESANGATGAGPLAADGLEALCKALREKQKIVVLWSGANVAVGRALLSLLDTVKGLESAGPRSVHLLIPGEQANSRGAEFMGLRPGWLPGFRRIGDEQARATFEKAWQVRLPKVPGWNTGEMLQAAVEGRLKAMVVAGANPVLTYPNGPLVRRALENLEFLVVQDLFLTETARCAHVVLPAAPFPAKEGTYTNLEGLVQGVDAGMRPGGESRSDGEILQLIAEAVGGNLVPSAQEFQWELQHLLQGAISGGRLAGAPRDLCSDDPVQLGTGVNGSPTAGAEVAAARGAGVKGSPSAGLRLVPVERLFAGGGTAYFDPGLQRSRPEPAAWLHPDDARRLELRDGDTVSLQAGGEELTVKIYVSLDVEPGTLQVPQGLPEAPVNLLLGENRYPEVVLRRRVLEEVS